MAPLSFFGWTVSAYRHVDEHPDTCGLAHLSFLVAVAAFAAAAAIALTGAF